MSERPESSRVHVLLCGERLRRDDGAAVLAAASLDEDTLALAAVVDVGTSCPWKRSWTFRMGRPSSLADAGRGSVRRDGWFIGVADRDLAARPGATPASSHSLRRTRSWRSCRSCALSARRRLRGIGGQSSALARSSRRRWRPACLRSRAPSRRRSPAGRALTTRPFGRAGLATIREWPLSAAQAHPHADPHRRREPGRRAGAPSVGGWSWRCP